MFLVMEEPKDPEAKLELKPESPPRESSASAESSPLVESSTSPIIDTTINANHVLSNAPTMSGDSPAMSAVQTQTDTLVPGKHISENGDEKVAILETVISEENKVTESPTKNGHENGAQLGMVVTGIGESKDRMEKVEDVRKKASENAVKNVYQNRGLIDTRAPFESVKEAVTKYGGITDWKAHKAQTIERSKQIKLELEKFHKEIPLYKARAESAELEKSKLLSELESAKQQVEELKHSLEKVRTEESQARQDSELAQLRAQEIQQGITDESSVAAKAQADLAKERHTSAVAELESVQLEFQKLQEQYSSLVIERDIAVRKAEEAVTTCREVEIKVEELTLELISAKENLESAHSVHLEAEEHRIGASLVREQDCLAWEKELKEREEELQILNEKYSSTKDLKLELNAATSTLGKLKAELAAYMETILSQEMMGAGDKGTNEAREIKRSIEEALDKAKKELEEVKGNVDKAKNEVEILKMANVSLKLELDNEKAALLTLQQREGMASIAVSSLEAELDRTKEELEVVRLKEKETREKMVELPKMLQQAAQEAEDAKLAAQSAQEELKRAQDELNHSKSSLTTNEIRLKATLKEIEASKAAEKLAEDAINALQESEQTIIEAASPKGITLPLEEYYAMSKQAHDAEQAAHGKVENALAQVEEAKEVESKCLEKLDEACKEMERKREGMKVALERAERAKEGKLGAEMELRKWRAENEQKRRANEAAARAGSVNPIKSPGHKAALRRDEKEEIHGMVRPEKELPVLQAELKLRRKKSFFPRVIMYIARKKAEGAR
ncbi:hypothetical protein LUZ63_005351 [Rhynchospora breviuscula]|uniref:Uncharacterized protein n=1 Tax=Rhynchospora breviuscula TaxID=2022672 RepID=A0A9Q0HSI9_9POAL|nr:hypothetical protein LUZ63_005351 [Rhynchospora breviuscula]